MVTPTQLAALAPIIQNICNVSGIPGATYGVLHHGNLIYQAGVGFADAENKVPFNQDTTFYIGALGKAMTGAVISSLIQDGMLGSWDTQLHTILPGFNRTDSFGNATITDILSHRVGLAPLDSLWMASNNTVFIPRSEAVPIFNTAPAAFPFRSQWSPSNFDYEMISQVIEKLSNASFGENLQQRILEPLGMTRTFYGGNGSLHNQALPYVALENGGFIRIPPPQKNDSTIMGASVGVRSTVTDLLKLYSEFLKATRREIAHDSTPSNNYTKLPAITDISHLWRAHAQRSPHALIERTYAMGWARTQLPGPLDVFAPKTPQESSSIVGAGASSRLAIHHPGMVPGYTSYAAIFPETNSAVVVLTNSLGLSNGAQWIAELLTETLFDNLDNAHDYVKVAQEQRERSIRRHYRIQEELAKYRGDLQYPSRLPINTYAGRYWNQLHNFFIDIKYEDIKYGDDPGILHVSFMGNKVDTFRLIRFERTGFRWGLTWDESARLGRASELFDKDYYIIRFEPDEKGTQVIGLRWRHDSSLPQEGELFVKKSVETFPSRFANFDWFDLLKKINYRNQA